MNHKRYSAATCLGLFLGLGLATTPAVAETIRIGIGHQSMVTNTVSGGIVLEKRNLISKYLPRDGKYQDVDYDIVFKDYDSGPPITNQMLAGKLDFGVMGDYPLIVNGAKFEDTGRSETRFIAITGYNKEGTGNGIVVPVDSPAQSLADLAGKSISTPVGSASWGMLLKALRDEGLIDKITIVNQSPPVGAANIAAGKIDAHADFCPWSEIMEFRGTGRKIYDGRQAGVPTFHGIVVRESYASDYPEVVEAVLQATLEAQQWIREDPVLAATEVSEWTGVEKEVLYLYFSNGGITTMDASVKPEWVAAMKYDHQLLQNEMQIPDLNFDAWVDDSYLRKAYASGGLDYDKALATLVSPVPDNPALKPAEIWYADSGIKKFDSIDAMLAAERKADQDGNDVNATYVHDKNSGLKLFGKSAFYALKGDQLAAFMRRPDAQAFASNGQVYSHQQILKTPDGNAIAER